MVFLPGPSLSQAKRLSSNSCPMSSPSPQAGGKPDPLGTRRSWHKPKAAAELRPVLRLSGCRNGGGLVKTQVLGPLEEHLTSWVWRGVGE